MRRLIENYPLMIDSKKTMLSEYGDKYFVRGIKIIEQYK